MQFSIHPVIKTMDSARELLGAYGIGAGDLIVTNRYVLLPQIDGEPEGCTMLYQEDFGSGEPSDIMIDGMLDAIRGKDIKRIFAIGGGTVLDISKLFVFGGDYDCEQIYEKGAVLPKQRQLIAVPTTCGTGSEMTGLTIAEITKKHTKLGLAVPQLFPDEVVLIDSLLYSLPYGVFATSSIDALIHCVEAFVSVNANVYTRMYSEKGIRMILRAYKDILEKDKAPEAIRANMKDLLIASNFGGIAFGNAGVTAVHALSYPVGANFHVPHGLSNYIMFGAVMRAYVRKQLDMSELETMIRQELEISAEKDVWEEFTAFLDRILARKPLTECGMTEEHLQKFPPLVIETQQRILKNLPVELSEEDYREIYKECM